MSAKLLLLRALLSSSTSFADGPEVNNPNHLEPINPFDFGGYNRVVLDALIGARGTNFWMICESIFEPEYAVILPKATVLEAANREDKAGSKKVWHLEIATARKEIWHWRQSTHRSFTLNLRRDVKVDHKTIEITFPEAKTFNAAWQAVLKRTRYAEKEYRGVDGFTYLFYADGFSGETWMPSKGLPAALVDLSARLKKCVESLPTDRQGLLDEAISKAGQIATEAAALKEKSEPVNSADKDP